MKTEIKRLDDLTIHPALKSQPRLSEDELQSWRAGMKRRGEAATPPLYITADNQIVDGRHRYWCARKLGWTTLPCVVVDESEIFTLIFETIAHRRHYTKGQLAYIVVPLLKEVFAEARARQLAGASLPSALSAKGIEKGSPKGLETPETVAASLGISYRVLAQAQEIHDLFADEAQRTLTDRDGVTEKSVTLREFFEPRILLAEDPEAPRTRAYGLGAVLAGIKQILTIENRESAGRAHGGGRPVRVDNQLNLFGVALHGLENKFEYWQKWDEDTRDAAIKSIPPVIEKMPDELLAGFGKAIKAEQKRRGAKG